MLNSTVLLLMRGVRLSSQSCSCLFSFAFLLDLLQILHAIVHSKALSVKNKQIVKKTERLGDHRWNDRERKNEHPGTSFRGKPIRENSLSNRQK